jgi:hypothetical protein
MPVACPWKRRVLVALLALAATLAGMPGRLCADQFVLCFAGEHLESGSAGRRFWPEGVHQGPYYDFAAADRGAGTAEEPHGASDEIRNWDAALATAALILLVGDVPAMPQTGIFDPGISGLPGHGGGSTSGGSTSPSATPEPTTLLSALLGAGLMGFYLICRPLKRRRSISEGWFLAHASG